MGIKMKFSLIAAAATVPIDSFVQESLGQSQFGVYSGAGGNNLEVHTKNLINFQYKFLSKDHYEHATLIHNMYKSEVNYQNHMQEKFGHAVASGTQVCDCRSTN